MKNKYDRLKEEFDKRVSIMQKKCKHKNTEWCQEWWAIGHSTGHQVKICKECNKVLMKK
jgi:hypothetical protein